MCKKGRWYGINIYNQRKYIQKRPLVKGLKSPWIFTFSNIFSYHYEVKEDLIVRLELISSQKVVLCHGDTAATYMLSGICLENVAMFVKCFAATLGELWVVCWTYVDPLHEGNADLLPGTI